MKKQTNKLLKLSFALFILFNISHTHPMKKLLSWLNPSALFDEFKLKKDFTSLGKLITYSKQNEAKSIIQKFTDAQKESLLFEVCEKDSTTYQASHGVTAVKMLLECDTNINCINNHNATPLIYACYRNNTKVAMALILNGADVNVKKNSKNTPLIIACYENNTEVAIALIRNGADVNAKNKINDTPIIIARNRSNIRVIIELIQNGAAKGCLSEIIFNHTFFTRKDFEKARNFASQHDTKDKFKRTILEAALFYLTGYYEKERNKFLSNFFGKFRGAKTLKEMTDAIEYVKRLNRKKQFRELRNMNIVWEYFANNKNIPNEVVAQIINFAGVTSFDEAKDPTAK